MIKVYVNKQSNYPVSAPLLKKTMSRFFSDHGITSDADVSVSLVSEKKMHDLSRRYLKDNKLHNVLSFPSGEGTRDFVYPPDNILHLGEIIVCYPKAFEEAKEEGKRLEEKVIELVEHGGMHLLGIHHE